MLKLPGPIEMSWVISGPNSGGGRSLYLSGGRLFEHAYGDEANCAEGESMRELAVAELGRYPLVLAELIRRGLVLGS